jgi:hypothetical protein
MYLLREYFYKYVIKNNTSELILLLLLNNSTNLLTSHKELNKLNSALKNMKLSSTDMCNICLTKVDDKTKYKTFNYVTFSMYDILKNYNKNMFLKDLEFVCKHIPSGKCLLDKNVKTYPQFIELANYLAKVYEDDILLSNELYEIKHRMIHYVVSNHISNHKIGFLDDGVFYIENEVIGQVSFHDKKKRLKQIRYLEYDGKYNGLKRQNLAIGLVNNPELLRIISLLSVSNNIKCIECFNKL